MTLQPLWVEKYRPQTLDDVVFNDESQRRLIQDWIDQKTIPQVLFTGAPGIGKTTLARILIKELAVNKSDLLEFNASRDNKIDTVRETITNFVQTMPFGEFKLVFLDEVDYYTKNSQAMLRGLMETYSNDVRFILTCNFDNKLMHAIRSRCQVIHFDKLDMVEFTARAATVLLSENVKFELEELDKYVKATYPDLRKCINTLEFKSIGNQLQPFSRSDSTDKDYLLGFVELFKQGKTREARKLLCSQVSPEETDDVFTWMYNNLDIWVDTEEQMDDAILAIRDGVYKHAFVAHTELNLSATLALLARIRGVT